MNLRRAGPLDTPAIHEVTHAAYAKWVPVIGCEPKPMTTDFAVAVREHVIDLLFEEDRLVGLIEMVPEVACLLIENVAVAPVFQGRGYGRQLLALAEEFAAANWLTEVRLYTNSRFAENLALYSRVGYREVRREDSVRGVIVHMRKKL